MTLLRESECFGVPHKKRGLLAIQGTEGSRTNLILWCLKPSRSPESWCFTANGS